MDEKDVLKAGVEVIAEPATDFLKKVSGAPGSEIGETFADYFRFRRWKRALKMLAKAKEIAEEQGFDPKMIPDRTLWPILDGASLEDDEEMTDRWAHLISAAAGDPESVPPSFPNILAELSPAEARIMDGFYDSVFASDPEETRTWQQRGCRRDKSLAHFQISGEDFDFAATNLLRLQLLQPAIVELEFTDQPYQYHLDGTDLLRLTPLGKRFVEACRT